MESKKIVAVGDGSGILAKVFTWDTGNSAGEMVGHSKRISTVSFKQSRPFRIMTGSEDMRTVFYSGPPFKFTSAHSTHTNFVNMVRFSPDGSVIVSVGSDKKIQFYDGASGEPTKEIPNAHDGTVFAVSFSSDGSKIVTASGDKTLKVWNVGSLANESTIPMSAEPQIGDMQQSVYWLGNNIVSLSLNGNLSVFNAADLSAAPRLIQAHQSAISCMCLDRASSTLYSGSIDGVVIARNLTTGVTQRVTGTDKKIICGGAHTGKVVGLCLNNGELTSVGFDDAARFASTATLAYYQDLPLSGQPIAVGSSGSLLAVVTGSEISLIRGTTKLGSLGGLSFTPSAVAVLGETEVAVGGEDNKVHIYSVSGGNTLTAGPVLESRAAITCLAYSPDGNFLAAGDAGRQIEVYERSSWSPKISGRWCFHTSKVTAIAWSPSGEYVASGSTDENIYIWNLNKPMSKANFPFAHSGGVTGVDWLHDKMLVSVGNDHVVATWNVPETA
jgi:WD repeat-containing protein 1 (actin-interacting protein 1)